MKIRNTISGIILLFCISANSLYAENPFDADIVVASDGTGDFTHIQAAMDAVPSNSERRTVIYIKRGLYDTEKLILTAEKINVSLIGESREETIISYHIHNCGDLMCPEEDAAKWTGDNIRTAATLTILGDGFRAENLTIQNTAGDVGQAQAITVRSDKCVFINCDLKGYQDTMYFWSEGKRSYFEGCLVVGRTDYIYGGAIVFFQDCEIRSWGGAYITAPSTPLNQLYGFVFNECTISYSLNSPNPGDDGDLIRFGRPWHNYPKVTWLRCDITEKLNPEGWGDKWNMEYADTSPDLHLYEYANTGPGANMSGRANWVGIKELTDIEALEYSVQIVLAGNDGWDPSAEPPLVQTYYWTDKGSGSGWMVAENWDPVGIPSVGEAAIVNGNVRIIADGGEFVADLTLGDSAELEITANSNAAYISAARTIFSTSADVSLDGRIATKDSIGFAGTGTLTLNSVLSGVHDVSKNGPGKLILAGDNINFSGDLLINSGTIEGAAENSLGKGALYIGDQGTIIVNSENAFQPTSRLDVVSNGEIVLNADIITSEFFINGTMQGPGVYTAVSNPGLISGVGSVVVGRPDIFTFIGGANGNWDNPAHYSPALLPLAGETAIVEKEMETTSTIFEADLIFRNTGILRLRGDPSKNHTCTGSIQMESGTSFKYNTGGTGMYLNAPVVTEGDISMVMESGNAEGSSMTLAGPVSGSGSIFALNNGKGTINTGTLVLKGDNSNFSGIWNLSKYSQKYPDTPGYISLIDGQSENAFGSGSIIAGHDNRVVISHKNALGDRLELTLEQSAKVILSVDVSLSEYILNGNSVPEGIYSAATNPDLYEGTGAITVGASSAKEIELKQNKIHVFHNAIHVSGSSSNIAVYDVLGHQQLTANNAHTKRLDALSPGIYIIQYEIDGESGVLKFLK